MKTYREFVAWQKAMTFVTKVYKTTRNFPREELFGLTSQIRRSAISIPSNFAEGFGRKGNNEFLRFIRIAIGSLYECQTQLEIAFNIEYLEMQKFEELFEQSREIEALLRGLEKKLSAQNS
ncbi:four helix bundle protein [Mangrovibacterium marinum]|uniref:Four helix bundle protein n=1 Tax=Mangrovibacterium marinum TaxID=1639118 RepID=A0A2T5C5N1_9BACT|nr:four helix bundle protein [Mangrovibacterium marinum]PTN10226.1 four helix bundle protein [Mangrovibacterium marinum]